MASAERLFAAGRYHEVTLDQICHKAGVGKGTIYRYFEDKEDLYYQVILSGLDELVESIQQVGQQECDPALGLRGVVQRVADFYGERRALFQLMRSEQLRRSTRKKGLHKQWRQKTSKMVDVIAGFVRDGIEKGIYSAAFPPSGAAHMLMAMVRSGLWRLDEMPDKDWPEAVVRLFENGLRTRNENNEG